MKQLLYLLLPTIVLVSSCKKDDTPNCPDGFTGTNCATEVSPQRVDLTSISATVTSTGWDVFPNVSPPDIQFVVENAGGTELLTSTACDNTNTCAWSGTLSFGANETCTIRIFDKDDIGRELIGSFVLDLYSMGQGFPTSHTSTLSGVTSTVTLSYKH